METRASEQTRGNAGESSPWRRGARVRKGSFREHMEVELVNDGPVTLLLEAAP